MKTTHYIVALLAGMAALSCVKETGKDLPAPQQETDLITIKAVIPESETKAGPFVGLSWGWQAGDKLAITGAEDTQIYTINDGFTAKYAEFTGRPVAGESFTIQYPDNAASYDWSAQTQKGNNGYDHLKYVATLSDVDEEAEVADSKETEVTDTKEVENTDAKESEVDDAKEAEVTDSKKATKRK